MDEGDCASDYNTTSDQVGPPEGTLYERAVPADISRKIRSRAMQVIDAGRKGGPHGHISVCRCIGDFGIPNLHRFGWCYWPEASSLNRGSSDSGFSRVAPSACPDRICARGQFAIGM